MFNEKNTEYYNGQNMRVVQTAKYKQSKEKALEIIDKYERIGEGDFWILMNSNKKDTMYYSGLIISHNGCLKINEAQPDEKKFKPSCVTMDKEGYMDSLVYTYCNDDQGIYEVGEFGRHNSKQTYPYAMAFKRLFDRVVLKLCGLAYDGVYSDSEADEFKERYEDHGFEDGQITPSEAKVIRQYAEAVGSDIDAVCKHYKVASPEALSKSQYAEVMNTFKKREEKNKRKG